MKITVALLFTVIIAQASLAQDEINWDNMDLRGIVGKVLTVKQGYAPKFFLGSRKIGKTAVLGKILATKGNGEINRLFRTFRTGRTAYKIASYAGAAVSVYGAANSIIKNSNSEATAKELDKARAQFLSGVGTIATGVAVKLLTKGASYKAVDLFGGVIRKKLQDILEIGVGVAPSPAGRPMMTTGLKLSL